MGCHRCQMAVTVARMLCTVHSYLATANVALLSDSYSCEPGSYCIQCPRDSPLYPGKHCCNIPQICPTSYAPAGYSFSSLPYLCLSAFQGLSSISGILPASASSSSFVPPMSSSSAPPVSSAPSSIAPASTQASVNYHYYTTTWIYYYIVYYATTVQATSVFVASSTTTTTTIISCYAANSRAAYSQFNTLKATISAEATSSQADISSSLFAAQGVASASATPGGSGSMANSLQIGTTTAWLLVIGAVLPGAFAVML